MGNSSVIDGGDTVAYVDKPGHDHPPNENGTYEYNPSTGKYDDGDGNTVEFTDGPGSGYTWKKRDSGGTIIDQGTMQPSTPNPAPRG